MKLEIEVEKLFLENPARLASLTDKARNRIFNRMGKETSKIVDRIKALIGKQRSKGTIYKSRAENKTFHIASKPGYSPNPDTFTLHKGISFEKEKTGFLIKAEAKSKKGLNYAPVMEFGTTNERVKPRPFFYNTITKRIASNKFQQVQLQMESTVKNLLRGVVKE